MGKFLILAITKWIYMYARSRGNKYVEEEDADVVVVVFFLMLIIISTTTGAVTMNCSSCFLLLYQP